MHEVQTGVSLTQHGYFGYAVVVNQCFWQSMTPSERDIVAQAMRAQTQVDMALRCAVSLGQGYS
jgi:C4-dicarboxylate-binding protein DctP